LEDKKEAEGDALGGEESSFTLAAGKEEEKKDQKRKGKPSDARLTFTRV